MKRLNLRLNLEDLNTKNYVQTTLEFWGVDANSIKSQLFKEVERMAGRIGALDMEKEKDQTQDLAHHKTEETDVLVKAERPAEDFMEYNEIDKETHGKKDK